MKIWECNGCEKHHMTQSEECPGYCFMTGRAIRNDCREVNGKNLPKLTVEELARRGIEWPEWSEGAVVCGNGDAEFYCGENPRPGDYRLADHIQPPKDTESLRQTWGVESPGRFLKINGKWDASDWKNSLIKKPEHKPEPRGWLEVGAVVYVRKEKRYGMIIGFDSISGDPIIGFRTGGAPYLMSEISQARKRLWNDEEMKKKVGKVFEDMNGELHLCLGFKIHKEICGEPKKYGVLYMAGCGQITHSSECLFNDGWKLEGNQCGELEHFDANKEEWLK